MKNRFTKLIKKYKNIFITTAILLAFFFIWQFFSITFSFLSNSVFEKIFYTRINICYHSLTYKKDTLYSIESYKIKKKLSTDDKIAKIINKILLGPDDSYLNGCQRKNLKCLSANVFDSLVIIDLSSEFKTLTQMEERRTIISIANTLYLNYPKIKKLHFKVSGINFSFLHGDYHYNNPLKIKEILKPDRI